LPLLRRFSDRVNFVIHVLSETGSTNEDMKARARDGAPEGAWLRAECQTAGRGRMGRIWEGEAGNLYASTLVRIRPGDPPPPTLALAAAVAAHRALGDFAGKGGLRIKWPNDILAGEAKLCGILMERVEDAIVIGFGVNIVSAPVLAGRMTTCLRDLGAETCDASSVLEDLAGHFAALLLQWRTYGVEPVARAWLERAHPAGTPLAVQLPDGNIIEGRFETLDRDGALILRLADGSSHAIHAGDVFLL